MAITILVVHIITARNGHKLKKRKNTMNQEMTALWDYLIETGAATEAELSLITSINGINLDSLESVLYSRTSYRSLEQILEMEATQ
jgi:hypothetical protein